MAQHFLLSAKARGLSVATVARMSDKEAFEEFKALRWPEGQVTCPECGCIREHYFQRTRTRWRCKDCGKTFSLTSGTIFAHHKLPLRIYLLAIAIFTNAVKGMSALQLARDLDVQYKTAYVLAHKIREALYQQRDLTPMKGEVHVDGAYVCGHVRPRNKRKHRKDRRLAKNQNPNKRCIINMSLRHATANLDGAVGSRRTITFVLKSENSADIVPIVRQYVLPGSLICCDENVAYDELHRYYRTERVNHQEEYRSDAGYSNNMAESFFARMRRNQRGQHHKYGVKYVVFYANEVAYRQDHRRTNPRDVFADIGRKCANTPTSRNWCGYWQGNKLSGEILGL